jgi:16S rRNA processing protein RimM
VADTPNTDPSRIEVGRVIKPHGLLGELSVFVLTDRPEQRYAPGAAVWLDDEPRTIVSSRPHQKQWLIHFEGVSDRNQAERLRARSITAAPMDGDDDSDTFWVHELVGLCVVTEDSEDLGDVVDVVELPAAAGYDLLEVKHPDGRLWYLPAADDLVQAVETEDGDLVLVVVDPPAGLLDEDAQEVVRPHDPSDLTSTGPTSADADDEA